MWERATAGIVSGFFLSAAIVGLGIIVISTLQPAIEDTAKNIADDMAAAAAIGE